MERNRRQKRQSETEDRETEGEIWRMCVREKEREFSLFDEHPFHPGETQWLVGVRRNRALPWLRFYFANQMQPALFALCTNCTPADRVDVGERHLETDVQSFMALFSLPGSQPHEDTGRAGPSSVWASSKAAVSSISDWSCAENRPRPAIVIRSAMGSRSQQVVPETT